MVVDFPDTDPTTGEAIVTLHTPESAVKRMKELPAIYGNLFKTGVVSGIGFESATGGLASGQSGKLDVRKLTPQQYAEIRARTLSCSVFAATSAAMSKRPTSGVV